MDAVSFGLYRSKRSTTLRLQWFLTRVDHLQPRSALQTRGNLTCIRYFNID
ncbi:hypothetical protein M3J09_005349 [Ascochyta lentis]